jgi:hypothetical protein
MAFVDVVGAAVFAFSSTILHCSFSRLFSRTANCLSSRSLRSIKALRSRSSGPVVCERGRIMECGEWKMGDGDRARGSVEENKSCRPTDVLFELGGGGGGVAGSRRLLAGIRWRAGAKAE